MERIGLIAGGGDLPIIFAREARKKGTKVIGFAIKDMAHPQLGAFCDRVHWFGIGELKKALFFFFVERIKKVAMLGKVDKTVIYSKIKTDNMASNILHNSGDRSDYSLLDKVTLELSKRGIEVINTAEFLSELVPSRGVLTKREPVPKEREDIAFGIKVAKEIAKLDIGQTIIIKNKAVVCVEAIEGTDNTIERASHFCKDGFTVVKVSRPGQDMRWDVPVVGPETVELIARYKGNVLALEEKRMFLVDKETCVDIADKNDISIVVV